MSKNERIKKSARLISNLCATASLKDEKTWATIIRHINSATADTKTKQQAPSKLIFDEYKDAMRRRYHFIVPTNAKNYSLCKTLAEYVGSETALRLVKSYVIENSDKWLVDRIHPLEVLVSNYQQYLQKMKVK